MPRNARTPESAEGATLLTACIWAILALTAYRIALLPFATIDLFVDEAQYWLWGQTLDWGYFSKPPLIGWVIRAFTELGGSDAAFWIRLPGPLLHCATALILVRATREIAPADAAGLVGLAYVSMPIIGIGTVLMSTDTVLLPFFAAALWCWARLTRAPSLGVAALMGLCLGLGMMAKYAAMYFWMCALIAVVMVPAARIRWKDAGLAFVVYLLVFSPNVLWNLTHGMTTVSHTGDNIAWIKEDAGITLNLSGTMDFIGAQFLAMGPILFAGYLWALVRRGRGWPNAWLVWMSLPVLALVTVQALLSRAYGNWALAAYPAALMLAIPALLAVAPRLLWAGLALNAALVLALPVAVTQATGWHIGDNPQPVLRRYTGRANVSNQIIDEARRQNVTAVMVQGREVLADLYHTARDSDVAIYAIPPDGTAHHYYAQTYPYPRDRQGAFLYVTMGAGRSPCTTPLRAPVSEWSTGPGAYRSATMQAYLLDESCWRAP
ncbi:ArnT family glycosyltransferase [Chachezhania antarctica]|uniref:ArnT family glycosyltransferase n=1 Tax=Chachezhania antarctica TaxID=2340860 RepID=UPI0013CEB76A|nr:glycosyltransferase family 39 protein [Chachezhania antarctica]